MSSVRPLVRDLFSYRVIVTLSYLVQMFLMTRDCVMTLTQGHAPKVKVTVDLRGIFLSEPYFSMLYLHSFIFDTNVPYGRTVYHGFDPMSRF